MANDARVANVANMPALGDILSQARDKKNITIEQAQKQTRINSTILKALEEGSCDSVLNAAYVKSFLKKYAEFLGLDPEQIVNYYKRLHPETETVVADKSQPPETQSRGMSQAIVVVKVIILVLVAAAVVVFVAGQMALHFKKQGIQKTAAVSKAKKSSASSRPLKIPPQKVVSAKKSTETLIPKNVQLKLLLKVNQTVMVKMRTDGNLLFERVLSKGTAEMFLAEDIINIYVAKGECVELILNGKSLGSPGKGLLKNVEITRSGAKVK